jgi:SAM-dependent methyltransferase
MSDTTSDETRESAGQHEAVRERYGAIAQGTDGGCCSERQACCDSAEKSLELGYSSSEIESVADGANLGLGCGNPTAIAELNAGETVLDLGSGAGFDCFLAADAVGPTGTVLGVDMTPEMVEKARQNIDKNDSENVEFRLGEIEHLPVSDETLDVVISNCVINLSPDKQQAFDEAFRVLRRGGRLAISDVVQTAEFPADVRQDPDAMTGCITGASTITELRDTLSTAGFEEIDITPKESSKSFLTSWSDSTDPSQFMVSSVIRAKKP